MRMAVIAGTLGIIALGGILAAPVDAKQPEEINITSNEAFEPVQQDIFLSTKARSALIDAVATVLSKTADGDPVFMAAIHVWRHSDGSDLVICGSAVVAGKAMLFASSTFGKGETHLDIHHNEWVRYGCATPGGSANLILG